MLDKFNCEILYTLDLPVNVILKPSNCGIYNTSVTAF